MSKSRPKLLAVSSGGGHWVQLLRLRPAFEGSEVAYATVRPGYRADVGDAEFHLIPDGNFSNKMSLVRVALGVMLLVIRTKPDVVVSTGAAPGYFALRFAKWFGARVVWIDSVANAEELSMSGRNAGGFADLWLTQWSHLASVGGPRYFGNVL